MIVQNGVAYSLDCGFSELVVLTEKDSFLGFGEAGYVKRSRLDVPNRTLSENSFSSYSPFMPMQPFSRLQVPTQRTHKLMNL